MREIKSTLKDVPSSDINDLFFNSGKVDEFVTSLQHSYTDRFGKCHRTIEGMNWVVDQLIEQFKIDINQAIIAAGYITLDSFQQGADLPNNEITLRNHILRDETTGEYYRWDGDLPKQVPVGSTPQSTGGIGKGAWVSVGDASLRSDLSGNHGSSLVNGIENQRYKKTRFTLQTGGIASDYDVVLDELSGMWYQWTGEVPHTFEPMDATPEQTRNGWICRGYLNQYPVNDPRNFGATSAYDLGFTGRDSTNAIQLLIDSVRLSGENKGENHSLDNTAREVIDFAGIVYNTSKPLLVQDDRLKGYRASGIRITNGGLKALENFEGVEVIENAAGDKKRVKSFFLTGTKDYATQSGHFCNFLRIDNFSGDGNNFAVDSMIYGDVLAFPQFHKLSFQDMKYGLQGKVIFLGNWTDWSLNNCNAIYSISNTSIRDGYNSGNGLEGGGNIVKGITIIGDGANDQSIPRIYQNRNGETNADNIISYNGLGDFLVIETDEVGATGTRWSRFKNIEVGDIGGRVARINKASYIELDVTFVKCGHLLGNSAPLVEVLGSNYIDMHLSADQFYDLPAAWTEVVNVVDSIGVNILPSTMRAMPCVDATYPMIAFRGTSQRCTVMPLTANIGAYTKRYTTPVYSEPTCKAISVIGGSFITGAFINGRPSLNGIGDSYTSVNTGDVSPITSPNRFLSTSRTSAKPTHLIAQVNLINISSQTQFLSLSFSEQQLHNANIEVTVVARTASGMAAVTAKHNVIFVRGNNSQSKVAISSRYGESKLLVGASSLDFSLTEVHSQFSLALSVTPSFSGSSPEGVSDITVLYEINSEYEFSVSGVI
ncbi:hypothetical protein ACY2L5_000138 [Providencia rettgeri]